MVRAEEKVARQIEKPDRSGPLEDTSKRAAALAAKFERARKVSGPARFRAPAA
jgi:hypothetical protein